MIENDNYRLYHGDCLEIMPRIKKELKPEERQIRMILADPPYQTITDLKEDAAWDIKINTKELFYNMTSLLMQKGRAVLFCQYPYSVEIVEHGKGNLIFQYFLYWIKNQGTNFLSSNKAPQSVVESIGVFYNKYDTQYENPLRKYADNVWEYIGKTMREIEDDMGNRAAEHFLYRSQSTQFSLCTAETYQKLIELYQINKMPGFKPFKELKELNNWGEGVFNVPDGQSHVKNAFFYKRDPLRVHPTQKPVRLLETLIKLYTNPGDTVLDFCMGSGSTGVACMNTGRKFIGIEKEEEYYNISVERIKRAAKQN